MAAGVSPTVRFSGLGQQEVEALIDVLPGMRKLEDVLHTFYYKLHDDKKLARFSVFFSRVLEDNPTVFKDLDIDQKAQILFDKYRELTLIELRKTADYQEAYQSFQTTMRAWFNKEISFDQFFIKKIDESCRRNVHYLHSCFVTFAVASSLGVAASHIHFSPDYQPRELKCVIGLILDR